MVPDQTTWTTDMDIDLMLLPSADDKTHYVVKQNEHSMGGDKGLITFTNAAKKDIKVFFKLLPATKSRSQSLFATDGGCGAGKVKYD